MGKSKQPEVVLPPKAQTQNVSLPNVGTSNYADNTWGINLDPRLREEQNQIQALKNAILSEVGITSAGREASLNKWQDTFSKEALRSAQPQYEQSMFARGLGGSRAYTQGLADLLSNVNTQAVLNREGLSNTDQQLMLQQLSGLAGLNQTNLGNISGVMNSGMGRTDKAKEDWYKSLPYDATVNSPGNSGLAGAGAGALSGAATGTSIMPGWGTLIGALIGGSAGYFSSRSDATSTPLYMSDLASQYGGGSAGSGTGGINLNSGSGGGLGSLSGGGGSGGMDLTSLISLLGQYYNRPQYANTSMGNVPIAPADYYKSTAGRSY